MLVKDIISEIERFAPPALKEDYDNVGLLVGSAITEVTGVLITLDVTEAVVDEAIQNGCNIIVAHHPLIFRGLKNITDRSETGRIVIKAIQNSVAIFAGHTNVDSMLNGVSGKMAQKLGLANTTILSPVKNRLLKLVTFVPVDFVNKVRDAVFSAGAGDIGSYDSCSYNTTGIGTFRAGKYTNPFVGEKGRVHTEQEVRVETILPDFKKNSVVEALKEAHPYEEVAYDFYPLENEWQEVGFGVVGDLEKPIREEEFLASLKVKFNANGIRYTQLLKKPITRVALCGGSGSEFLGRAISSGADIYISADFKYHQFFEAENRILIADIGHFESEQFTKELFYEILTKKFSNFAVRLSKVNTNPIKYL